MNSILPTSAHHCYLRLTLLSILDGKFEECWAALGVCCSSWVVTSRGSTGRSWMLPMGKSEFHSVESANRMVTRTGCFGIPSIFPDPNRSSSAKGDHKIHKSHLGKLIGFRLLGPPICVWQLCSKTCFRWTF